MNFRSLRRCVSLLAVALAGLLASEASAQSDSDATPGSRVESAAPFGDQLDTLDTLGESVPAILAVAFERDGETVRRSGFVISESGYALTVGLPDDEVDVQFADGSTATADVLGVDEVMNVALLKIDDDTDRTALSFGRAANMETPRVGIVPQTPYRPAATTGLLKGIDLRNDGAIHLDGELAFPDESIGAPLLDRHGEVIGVVVSGPDEQGLDAVPIDVIKPVVDQLKAGDPVAHSRLGLRVQVLDEKLAEKYGVPPSAGVVVSKVLGGSPADGHLQAGDLLTGVDYHPVEYPADVTLLIGSHPPSSEIEITSQRDGVTRYAKITLGTREKDIDYSGPEAGGDTAGGDTSAGSRAEGDSDDDSGDGPRLGASIKPVDEDLAESEDLTPTEGLFVVGIQDGAPADGTLELDDVILSVNRTDVTSIDEIKEMLSRQGPGEPTRLRVFRDGNELLLSVDLFE